MTKLSAGGQLSTFAHLIGGVGAKAKRSEDPDDNGDGAEGDDGRDIEDDDDGDGDIRKPDDEADDDSDDEDAKKNTRKTKKTRSSASAVALRDSYRAGFAAAQTRAAEILGHSAAAANFALAAQLAATGRMPAKEAIGIMKAATTPPAKWDSGFNSRMSGVKAINVGADGDGGSEPATPQEAAAQMAARTLAAARKAGATF